MKTTLDLPADLVRRLKLRAIRDQRKLKDVAAEMLRKGLAAQPNRPSEKSAAIVKDKKTGLPLILCRRPAARQRVDARSGRRNSFGAGSRVGS